MADLDIIEISDEQAQGAKLLASGLSTPDIRKRGIVDMLGISCAVNYLNAKGFRIETKQSVYKIPRLFEEFRISDIYYKNYRIDVITLYKEKNVKIPKIHHDMDIMPNFYFVVQIGAKIKEAKMIGFIEANKVHACSHDSKYFYPTLDMIFDVKKFASLTRYSIASKTLLGKHIDCLGLFLKFIDGDLSSVYKRQMIQHLMNCDSCRARFIDTVEFEKLSENIKYYPELIRKYSAKPIVLNKEAEQPERGKFATIEEKLNDSLELEKEESPVAVMEAEYDNFEENSSNDNIEDNGDNSDNINRDDKEEYSYNKPKEVEIFDFSDSLKTAQSSKKIIDNIFNKMPKVELPQIKTIANAKSRRILLVSVILLFVLGSFALISVKGSSDVDLDENLDTFEEPFEDDYDGEYSYGNGVAKLIPKQRKIEDYAIAQQKIAEPAYSPNITRISWEAPESIAQKDSYKKYLQLAGKNIKLNLQNDLLLVNDVPVNKMVRLDIRVSADGDVEFVKLISSSGSDQIDASVRKVVKETLNFMKPPSHGIISKPIDITLTTELN